MKLSRIFQSYASAFREAVKTDDLPAMEKLMGKKGSLFVELASGEYVRDLSPRMAEFLLSRMDEPQLRRWGFSRESAPLVKPIMVGAALEQQRFDVVELLVGKKEFVWNEEKFGAAMLSDAVASAAPDDQKMRVLRAILAGGHDKMDKPEQALQAAVDKNFTSGIDLFAAVGFDLHKNNEQYLRSAAAAKSGATALHLVTRHGADVDLAIATEMALGNAAVFEFLTELKKQLPQTQAPRTVESLTAEVGSLQDTVRELTQKLAKLEGGQALDKPVLKSPAP